MIQGTVTHESSVAISIPLESPPCVFTSSPTAHVRMVDFFAAHTRNPHTRRAYMGAVR